MADENTKSLNGLALKSRDGYTGKLFLPSTADIATLNTAQADITTIQNSISTIDPTARFIIAATEPSTADDGKIWIEVEPRYSLDQYCCDPTGANGYSSSSTGNSLLSSENGAFTIPVLVTDAAYTTSAVPSVADLLSDMPSKQLICYPGKTMVNNSNYRSIYLMSQSAGTTTARVTMTVTGPLKLTKFTYAIDDPDYDIAKVTINNYSKTDISASLQLSLYRSSSSGAAWNCVNVDYEITATGTGTGSIIFTPCISSNYISNHDRFLAWWFATCAGYHGIYSYVNHITN